MFHGIDGCRWRRTYLRSTMVDARASWDLTLTFPSKPCLSQPSSSNLSVAAHQDVLFVVSLVMEAQIPARVCCSGLSAVRACGEPRLGGCFLLPCPADVSGRQWISSFFWKHGCFLTTHEPYVPGGIHKCKYGTAVKDTSCSHKSHSLVPTTHWGSS